MDLYAARCATPRQPSQMLQHLSLRGERSNHGLHSTPQKIFRGYTLGHRGAAAATAVSPLLNHVNVKSSRVLSSTHNST